MLVITGTGRCGTSLLSHFLQNCGYVMGTQWFPQIDAGFENPHVVEINEALRRRGADCRWCKQAIRSVDAPAVKDPRFSFPGVLSYWAACRDDLRLLVCVRNPSAVASSLAAHNHFTKRGQIETEDAIARRMADFVVELAKSRLPCRLLPFPDFIHDYERVYRLLTDFGGLELPAKAKATWNSVRNPEKVHF